MALIEFTAGTPTHWKEYQQYVRKYNKGRLDTYIEREKRLQDEYDALPWYKKIFHQNPSTDWLRDAMFMPRDMKESLIGYYNWDVNIRRKK